MEKKYNRVFVFTASALTIFLFGMVMISLGSLLPFLAQKLLLSDSQLAFTTSALPFGVLLGSMFFGPIVDTISYKTPLLFATFFILLGMLGLGLAINFFVVITSLFVLGAGGGAINGITMAIVSQIFDKKRAAMLTFLGVFFALGSIAMPLLISLFETSYSISEIVLALSASVSVPMLLIFLIKFPKIEHVEKIKFADYFKIFTGKSVIVFSIVLFFASSAEGVVNNWTTTYIVKTGTLSKEIAVAALVALPIAMACTRFMSSIILSKKTENTIYIISIIFAITGASMLFFINSQTMAYVCFAFFGIGLSSLPILIGKIGDSVEKYQGTAISIALTFALFGNVISNFFTGLAAEKLTIKSFPLILLLILFMLLLSFITAIALTKKKSEIVTNEDNNISQ